MSTLHQIIDKSVIGQIRHAETSAILPEYIEKIGGSSGLIYIGANTGQEIEFCKNYTQKIYAFEPIPFDSVWGQLIKHQCEKVFCYNCALSDEEGEFEIYPSSNNFESSSLLKPKVHLSEFNWVHFADPIKVKSRRLDSFKFAKECDVIIMDVQGAELKVLNGISNFDNFKLIILEYNVENTYDGACTFDELENKLTAEGFEYYESYGVYNNPNTEFYAGNAVFIRKQ
jgi:FkbM family methyltransferase